MEEGQSEAPRMVGDEGEVPIRLAAPPAVVDVADREAPARLSARLDRAEEQRQRVGAARHGEQDASVSWDPPRCGRALQGLEDGIHPPMVRRDPEFSD